ncbi:GolD/DthD family dehydrogenase [Salinibacterium sp. ZJ77]|uniref:GolD/DthD family dehydrogenase n=1 Tax=Salinibacterium sp. ZJ77 TaxID=2708337 RepID=UPI00142008FF|nr:D-threitol dehydrogenase [Salinibacterium sp. ZJ77]
MHSPTDGALAGQVALVTGGAAGIGLAIATELQRQGARCYLLDVSPESLDHAASVLVGAVPVQVDVSDVDAIGAAVDRIRTEAGRIDILVNSAGIGIIKPALEITLADWQRTLDINLRGTFFMSQAVARHMIPAGRGRIVNIASKCGTIAIDDHAAYTASKAGVVGMTKVLAGEWAPHGITVNCVSPTVVLTELAKNVWHGDIAEQMLAKIPVGRFATPEDVAEAVAFLVTQSGMVTGHDLLLDGGYVAR